MGRILEKDKTHGWQYLKAILDFAIAQGVKRINATVNDAVEKAKILRPIGACQKIGKLNTILAAI